MAEKGLIEKSTMDAIADAIRTKLESSDLMLPSEMPALIGTIKGDPTLQSKTVTPSESAQSVTADAGYDGLDTVTVNAIPSEYVKPTATKGATTYTPGTTAQTIAAGTYCSGAQTIAGDANLVAANIVSGKTIFGVAGSAATGAKVMVGKFTVAAANKIESYKITHGLGVEPNLIMLTKFDSFYNIGVKHLWSLAQTSVGGDSVSAYRASAGGNTTFETGSWSVSSNETDTTISTSGSNFIMQGTYYYVIGVI